MRWASKDIKMCFIISSLRKFYSYVNFITLLMLSGDNPPSPGVLRKINIKKGWAIICNFWDNFIVLYFIVGSCRWWWKLWLIALFMIPTAFSTFCWLTSLLLLSSFGDEKYVFIVVWHVHVLLSNTLIYYMYIPYSVGIL